MRTVLVLLAGLVLAMPVYATPKACPPGHEKIGSCVDGQVVPYPGDTINNYNGDVNNGNIQGQQQGQAQGQIATGGNATGGSVTVGDTTLTTGASTSSVGDVNTTFNFGGEEGQGSFNSSSDSSTTIGDTTLTNGSNSTSSVGDVSGGSINVYGGEEGESGAFSSTATNGDQTTTVTNTDNSFDGGNTLIIGGSNGEGEGAGAGTLNSSANAEGGSAVIEEGANTNNNTNTATGGNVESGAVVVENNVTVEGGEQIPQANNQTVEGDTTDIDVDARTINQAAEIPVNSAAPSFSGICNSGAAGSGKGLSLSLAVTNDVCQCLMMADAYMAIGDVEEAHKWVRAAGRHAKAKGAVGYIRHIATLGIL